VGLSHCSSWGLLEASEARRRRHADVITASPACALVSSRADALRRRYPRCPEFCFAPRWCPNVDLIAISRWEFVDQIPTSVGRSSYRCPMGEASAFAGLDADAIVPRERAWASHRKAASIIRGTTRPRCLDCRRSNGCSRVGSGDRRRFYALQSGPWPRPPVSAPFLGYYVTLRPPCQSTSALRLCGIRPVCLWVIA